MSSDSKSREPSPSTSSSRKRPRTEITPEERREARAHRNRIAAQNSRDRKKAHYSLLERRVAELEEENRRLKAGLPVPTPAPTTSQGEQDAKDKENQELRMRIATLEEGLEAVVKAFTTHGVPSALTGAGSGSIAALSSGLAGPTGSTTSPSALTATIPSPSSSHPSPMSPPTTLTPSTDLSSTPSFPVPSINDLFSTPSSSTLSLSSAPTPLPTPTLIISSESGSSEPESTRHLARVATMRATPRMSLQRVDLSSALTPPHLHLSGTETTMTTLLSHPSPPLSRTSLPLSITRQWKLSSARSSTVTPVSSSQRRPRVYRLLICSRLPDRDKPKRQKRRRQRMLPRRK
ncbi:hypothetical protein E1B28_007943 [Marasmius oreades]|uniref:BZIP domain-containing protein n=1 Tax=Marasmius oreades TaxID=181124 RepID=A0A9P7S377_9AGAR|nr:uncharacterized protein E1B28_007943 [Marasmius oreades]KAG7094343.1 hypothetical protein E1B28_007943 [Marasmius oreades]